MISLSKFTQSISLSRGVFLGLALVGSVYAAPIAHPPIAEMRPYTMTIHGDTRQDPYFWLRNKEDPKVIEYLNAENDYTQRMMSDTVHLQNRLFEEMKARMKEDDESLPYKDGNYFYFNRTESGKQYPVYLRKKVSAGSGDEPAKEELLLDLNELAEGKEFLRLGTFDISPNEEILAFSIDTEGSRKFTLSFKNLISGEILNDQLVDISSDVVWANDNTTLFYAAYDESMRTDRVYRHALGTDQKDDVQVAFEADEKFDLSVSKSSSQKYIFISSNSKKTAEMSFIPADAPLAPATMIAPRREDHRYGVEHRGDMFYILTNDQAKDYRVMRTSVDTPSMDHWQEYLPTRNGVSISDMSVFRDFMALTLRENGLTKIHVITFATGLGVDIQFPDKAYTVSLGTNAEFDTTQLRFDYESMVFPNSTFDYDVLTHTQDLKKQTDVPGYHPEQYETERTFVTAKDGAQIPVSIVYKKGMKKDGTHPALLYGYGSYGVSLDPYFSLGRVSLLDRGFVYAIAHIRGGGELGDRWYEDGKLFKKKNTFDDFIRCAEFLVGEGYTRSDLLAIEGASAGGLLMGAVMNERPDLFKVVLAGVPFVDVINSMLDADMPLTTGEYEEWGNPNDPEYYAYMKSYAPYENIERKDYPHLLLTTGLNDSQVGYWEPAKFAARLRTMKTDSNFLLLKTDMGVGHGGASGRYDSLKERAFELAFMLKMLGIQE